MDEAAPELGLPMGAGASATRPTSTPTASGASAPATSCSQEQESESDGDHSEPGGSWSDGAELAGAAAMSKGQYEAAVAIFTAALRAAEGAAATDAGDAAAAGDAADARFTLLANRSAAFTGVSDAYRSRPASRSESSALYGLDPTHLAQLALADANKVVAARPLWPQAHARKAHALFLLERYPEAEAAYLQGLSVDPEGTELQAGLSKVSAVLGGAKAAAKRQRSLDRTHDELECVLCMRLLYEPVTTPCGHTFCRGCYARSTDHGNKCPLCRTVLHCGRQLPVTVTLAGLISRSFASEYEERRAEEAAEAAETSARRLGGAQEDGTVSIPLFVMNVMLPGETMALNIFEPRYRLMVRRAMEGNRRIGMAQTGPNRTLEAVFTECEILECNALPDGRFHVEVIGRRRMRVLSTSDLDGYRLAQAEPMSDLPEQAGVEPPLPALGTDVATSADALVARLSAMSRGSSAVREMLRRMGPRPAPSAPAASDDAAAAVRYHTELERLSFWVCALLVQIMPSVRGSTGMEQLRATSTRTRLLWSKAQMENSADSAGERCCIM